MENNIIEKIQQLIIESDAEESKKKNWQIVLHGLKKINFTNNDFDPLFEALYLEAKTNINVLDSFLYGIGTFVKSYIKGGEAGLNNELDKQIEKVDKKLKEIKEEPKPEEKPEEVK